MSTYLNVAQSWGNVVDWWPCSEDQQARRTMGAMRESTPVARRLSLKDQETFPQSRQLRNSAFFDQGGSQSERHGLLTFVQPYRRGSESRSERWIFSRDRAHGVRYSHVRCGPVRAAGQNPPPAPRRPACACAVSSGTTALSQRERDA